MKNLTKQALACVLVAGVTIPTTTFATNGYFSHGYGTKNKGLAGGGVALPQDAMIAATNPAGMALVGERYDVGLAAFSPSPRSYTVTGSTGTAIGTPCGALCPFEIGPETEESNNDLFAIPHFAYNWQLASDRTVGLTVYGNGGMNTEYKNGTAKHTDTGTGTFESFQGTFGAGTGDVGVNLAQLFMNASYAVKFGADRALGVGLIGAYQRFSAQGLKAFGDFGFSTDPTNLTNNGTDTGSGFGLKFGIQDKVGSNISFGASYQTEIKMSKFSKYKGLFAEQGNFDIPATITLGFAFEPSTASTITFDLQKIYYSDVPSIANPFSGLLTGCGSGADATQCLGGANGAGFGWTDMTIMKFGYQWSASPSMVLRAGYSKGDQPIGSSEVMFNILAPAVIEEHLTFGLTKALSKSSELNFSAMYAKHNAVDGPNLMAGGAQTISIEMEQYEFELGYSRKF